MKSNLEITDGVGQLLLVGDLTIEQAEELRGLLLQSLDESESLTINLEQITRLDLAGLQLLSSIGKSCEQAEKTLNWQGQNSKIIRTAMEEAGYSCLDICSQK